MGTGLPTNGQAETVELLGIDGVDDEAPIQQSIDDGPVRDLDCERDNARAAGDRGPNHITLVPGATHLFEESGALEIVVDLAGNWFTSHLAKGA